jgi:tRNA (guanine-N7-)-methyltransferase
VARSPRLPPDALQPYLLDVPHPRSPRWRELSSQPRPLAWPLLFGNDRPVEIEVGFGKGMFLIDSGSARPDTNFLGIEIERKYVMLTAGRLAKRRIANVRLACTDARWLLKECVSAESVQAVHVFFPDPWWKQRHQKRKLFTAEFAGQCARVLVAGGELNFVSDVAEYFEETCAMLIDQHALRRLPAAPDPPGFATSFERKYRNEGRTIYRASWVK